MTREQIELALITIGFVGKNPRRLILDSYSISDSAFGVIVEVRLSGLVNSWKCGYLAYLENAGMAWDSYDEIDSVADVHGGITYGERKAGYAVLGFDTAHVFDDKQEFSMEWMRAEIQKIADAVLENTKRPGH